MLSLFRFEEAGVVTEASFVIEEMRIADFETPKSAEVEGLAKMGGLIAAQFRDDIVFN